MSGFQFPTRRLRDHALFPTLAILLVIGMILAATPATGQLYQYFTCGTAVCTPYPVMGGGQTCTRMVMVTNCIVNNIGNAFVGSMDVTNCGVTGAGPTTVTLRASATAGQMNPRSCIFMFSASGYMQTTPSFTGQCTPVANCSLSTTDGLPVELMEFSVEDSDEADTNDSDSEADA